MSEQGTPTQAGQGEGRAPVPPGTLRIGSIRGVDVLVRSSWLLVAIMFAVLLAPQIEQAEPGLGAWKYVAGLAYAVLFYLSLLLHEVSHALMAQRYGLGVRCIVHGEGVPDAMFPAVYNANMRIVQSPGWMSRQKVSNALFAFGPKAPQTGTAGFLLIQLGAFVEAIP